MYIRWGMVGLWLAIRVHSACAQPADTARWLAPVQVRASVPERFGIGQKWQRIDSAAVQAFRFSTLQDVLAFQTPLAFKTYGAGQLTTVSFRGTSPNHTAVLWNGININQPTLGQTDFSTIPVAAFTNLSVQYGAAGSRVGSDAVGGTILLDTQPDWRLGWHVQAAGQMGSFRNSQAQVSAGFSRTIGERWQVYSRTLGFGSWLKNVYPYAMRGPYVVEPSTTTQRGLTHQLAFRHQMGQQVSLYVWLNDNDLLLTPGNLVAREKTQTQAARWVASYETARLTIRMGWLQDKTAYGKGDFGQMSYTVTDRLLGRAEHEWRWLTGIAKNRLTLRTGAEWSHYRTRADGYGDTLITENRQDLYVLLRWQTARWLLSATGRQAFVTRFNPPFAPSVGAEFAWMRKPQFHLTPKASVAAGYRVPTLNERYWQQLGNPNLKPEQSLNAEVGLKADATLAKALYVSAELTAYQNWVSNWIYWNPARQYHVENLQQVLARGLEWMSNLTYQKPQWQTGLRIGYAYTRSSQQRAYDAYARDVVGKQLPFVPLHTVTAHAYLTYGRWRTDLQTQTASRRYKTADNSQWERGTFVANWLVSKTIGHDRLRLQTQINNIFDALIINVKGFAMPGRSVQLNLVFNFTSHTNS